MASVVISGDTSGAITVSAPAVAGTNTLTLPAVTDTLTGIAATQTLTNKTLTSPTLTTPALGTPASGVMTNVTGINYDGYKNRIINGAMVIDQRNAGASATNAGTGTYYLDRWLGSGSVTSKFSVQQNAGAVTPPTGFSNYLGVTSLSAYTVGASESFLIRQAIEGFNTADLVFGTASASSVTLSFWVRSSLTGTFGGALYNSGGTRSYPFTYTISVANTWEQKSITVAGDTSGTWVGATNGIGLYVSFNLGAGSTVSNTAGAWATGFYPSATGATSVVGTNGATFYITGVQLEKGSTATSFDYRPYSAELAMCQRYYEKSYDIETKPASNTDTGRLDFAGSSEGNQNVITKILYKVTKRAAPTMVGYVGVGTSGSWTYEKNGASGTATVTFDVISQSSARVYVPIGTNWVVGYIYGQWTASAEL